MRHCQRYFTIRRRILSLSMSYITKKQHISSLSFSPINNSQHAADSRHYVIESGISIRHSLFHDTSTAHSNVFQCFRPVFRRQRMSTFAWHFLALIFLQINLYHLRHQLVQLIRRTAARKTQTTMPPWSQLPTCGGGFPHPSAYQPYGLYQDKNTPYRRSSPCAAATD